MRILVTGSREWTDRYTVEVAIRKAVLEGVGLDQIRDVVVVHGDARGADSCADVSARAMALTVEAHPADWQRLGRAAGVRRNQEMVDAGADICLAFFDGPSSRNVRLRAPGRGCGYPGRAVRGDAEVGTGDDVTPPTEAYQAARKAAKPRRHVPAKEDAA